MYCSNCGHEIVEGASFCSNCGNPISQENPSRDTPKTDLDYMRYDLSLNFTKYRQLFISGYIVDAVVSVIILVVWLLLEPVNLNAYFYEDVFRWPIIICGLLALIISSILIQFFFLKRASNELVSDIRLAGKQMMWKTLKNEKAYFDIIRQMNLAAPANDTMLAIIFSAGAPTTKMTKSFITRAFYHNCKQIGIVMQGCAKEIEQDTKASYER